LATFLESIALDNNVVGKLNLQLNVHVQCCRKFYRLNPTKDNESNISDKRMEANLVMQCENYVLYVWSWLILIRIFKGKQNKLLSYEVNTVMPDH